MELGFQDGLVLRRRRSSFRDRNVASDPRDQRVSEPAITKITDANKSLSSRSAAELDELFERKIKAWRFHKTETATQRLVEVQNKY